MRQLFTRRAQGSGATSAWRGRRRELISLTASLALVAPLTVLTGPAAASNSSIPLGPYCGAACQAALQLSVAPSSVNCKVAFLDDATSFPYGATQYKRTATDGKKYFPNMKLTVLNGNNDPTTESNQLRTVVAEGYKVVILDAVVKDALGPAAKYAISKGVKIVEIDRTVDAPVLTTIKAPDVPLGEREMGYVAAQMHGKGNIIILSGTPGASPTIDRTTGIENVLKKFPGIHVLSNINGNYDTSTGYTVVRDALSRYAAGKVDWIVSEADVMTLGAVRAIAAAHRQGTVKLASIDGQNEALAIIGKNGFMADVVYPVVEPADVVAAAKACTGETMPKSIALDYPLVTQANVKTYIGTNFG
jgi:ribose transport system substrate-binding protein